MIKNSRVKIVLWIAVAAIGLGLISCVLIRYLSYQSQLRQAYTFAHAVDLSDQDLLQSRRFCATLSTDCGPALTFETDLSLNEFQELIEQQGTVRSQPTSGFSFLSFFGYRAVTLDGEDFRSASINSPVENTRAVIWSSSDDHWRYSVYFTELSTQPGRLAYEGRPFNRNVVSIFVRPIP
jgi:hypothetical protein